MAYLHIQQRELHLKIVYCGSAFSGKTTNLQSVHRLLQKVEKSELVSLASRGDRTMFFDFISVRSPQLGNYTVRFQIYTVPGQPRYATTRQLVLRGVDGVIFVADSGWDRMADNVEAFTELERCLALNDLTLDKVPLVLQYNKRDRPDAAPRSYLDFVLNNHAVQHHTFDAVATDGSGVAATLNCLAGLLVERYTQQMPPPPGKAPPPPIP
jgi:signal recognition particle receptor subunit beta